MIKGRVIAVDVEGLVDYPWIGRLVSELEEHNRVYFCSYGSKDTVRELMIKAGLVRYVDEGRCLDKDDMLDVKKQMGSLGEELRAGKRTMGEWLKKCAGVISPKDGEIDDFYESWWQGSEAAGRPVKPYMLGRERALVIESDGIVSTIAKNRRPMFRGIAEAQFKGFPRLPVVTVPEYEAGDEVTLNAVGVDLMRYLNNLPEAPEGIHRIHREKNTYPHPEQEN